MQDLKELNEVITAIKEEIRQGADALTTSKSVYEFKKTFLDNKQGRIGLLMKEMRNVANDQKAEFGKTINGAKEWANNFFDELDQKLKEKEQQQRYESEKIDITMPPVKILHIIHRQILKFSVKPEFRIRICPCNIGCTAGIRNCFGKLRYRIIADSHGRGEHHCLIVIIKNTGNCDSHTQNIFVCDIVAGNHIFYKLRNTLTVNGIFRKRNVLFFRKDNLPF